MKVSCTTKETLKRDKFLLPLIKERFVVKRNGKIYSKHSGNRVGKPRNKNSYGGIGVVHDGKNYFINTHRAIWLVHKGFVPVGYTLNHKNGIKSQSRLSNLECVTPNENGKHAYKLGLNVPSTLKGYLNPCSKLTIKNTKYIRKIFKKYPITRHNCNIIARKYNVSRTTIFNIAKYKTYTNVP